MTLLTVGTDCAIARALDDAAPLAQLEAATTTILAERPDQIAIVALPAPAGPIGAMATDRFAALTETTVTLAIGTAKVAAQLEHPVHIAIVCPADAIHPDHLDGARSVIGAGLAMLVEVAAALPTITINAIAVADDVPAEEVAAMTRFVLSGQTPSLNGTTIRLDGGRDAVLAAETRAEGD
jgi:hypothetical protein